MPIDAPTAKTFGRRCLLSLPVLTALLFCGCATLPGTDAPRVDLVGIEPLPSEGFEARFAVRLRVQNPNDRPIEYDGIALDIEVNGNPLAFGVSDAKGSVPRFGETVLSVPVTVSAWSALRQAMGLVNGETIDALPYRVHGKLAGGVFGTLRFSSEGRLSWPKTLR